MPTITMLSEEEREMVQEKVEEYANLDEEGDLTKYLFDDFIADGDVELRMFPTPEEGPVEGLHFSVDVLDDAEWKEQMGSYSSDNLYNGGPHYEALAEELEEIVENAINETPSFVMEKGSRAFTEDVEV